MSHYKTIQALGTPHVTHQGIVAMLDDFELAVMLSHLMYWADKTDNPLGVYRSNADWYELFRFKEAKAKKLSDELQKRGLITKTHKRLEHRIYYLFNADEFDRQYEQFANLKNDGSPIAKTKIGKAQKSRLADSENQGSLYTKITTKNTTKITTESEYAPTHESEQTHFADEKNSQEPSANKQTSETSSAKKPTITYAPPSDLTPTPTQIQKCEAHGIDAHSEFENFTSWAIANGKGYANWSMGFSTWIKKSISWGKPQPTKPTWQPPQPQPAHNNQTTFDEHGNIITGASYANHQTNHQPNNQPVKRNSQAEYELIREQRHKDLRAMGYDI